jgi:hypothetical protein
MISVSRRESQTDAQVGLFPLHVFTLARFVIFCAKLIVQYPGSNRGVASEYSHSVFFLTSVWGLGIRLAQLSMRAEGL